MDAFDTFWRWADKDLTDHTTTIDAELHHAVTSLPEEDWQDRQRVNEAARLNEPMKEPANEAALLRLRNDRLG